MRVPNKLKQLQMEKTRHKKSQQQKQQIEKKLIGLQTKLKKYFFLN
jgi:hypothetical protein